VQAQGGRRKLRPMAKERRMGRAVRCEDADWEQKHQDVSDVGANSTALKVPKN